MCNKHGTFGVRATQRSRSCIHLECPTSIVRLKILASNTAAGCRSARLTPGRALADVHVMYLASGSAVGRGAMHLRAGCEFLTRARFSDAMLFIYRGMEGGKLFELLN
jgi:hypothetical protein